MLDRPRSITADNHSQSEYTGSPSTRQTLLARAVAKVRSLSWIFFSVVLFPTFCAILYFCLFASDIYISEAKFVVRAPDKPATSGIGVLLKTAGFSNAGAEVYAARDYLQSRDATRALNGHNDLANAYGSSSVSIFDRFDPLGWDRSFEALHKYYQDKIRIEYDSASSITTLSVRAFTPGDARRFNAELLKQAELLVNRLNTRGQRDLISVAETEVAAAKARATEAALALSVFRNREGVVDPEKQAAVQLQMVSKLQDQLIAIRIQLLQLRTYTPANPQIPVLEAGAGSLARQIDEEISKVAGGRKSLSSTAAQYQRLQLESQFADKQLAATMSSLEEARNEARRKQAYVERIAEPSLPDSAREPRRLRGILTTLIVGLIAWGVLSMLLAGVREHRD